MHSRFTAITDNLFASLLWQALWYAVIPFLFGGGVIIWEVARNSWGPWTLALGVFAAASMMVFINGVLTSKRYLEHSPSAWGRARLEQRLRDWAFDGGGFGIAPTRGRVNDDAEFSFDVLPDDNQRILVVGSKNKIDLTSSFNLTYGERTLEQVTGENAAKVHLAVRQELLKFGIGFGHSEGLDELMLVNAIPRDDSLNQFVFLQQLFFLRRAMMLAIEVLALEIAKYSPPEESN